MADVMATKKKWCIHADGFDNVAGLPIMIHQKVMAYDIHGAWEEFKNRNYGVTFAHIFVSEVT